MKFLLAILFVCLTLNSVAQVNYVRNPDLEQYSSCPVGGNLINRALYWSSIIDSASEKEGEYFNACGNSYPDVNLHIPLNVYFYQFPHSDSGMIGLTLYNDKSGFPPSPLPFDYRDYMQGRFYKALINGKTYCVSFWVNMSEISGYGHNKIGAYLDDGSINSAVDSAAKEITSVIPQVYTNTIVRDTQNWVKVQGSFVAKGNETMITIGNFFPNSALDTTSSDCTPGGLPQYSYYIFDDVSIVAIDSKANAGVDRWVELGKKTQIGPLEDSTARGMDCKWYHKGKLIDSGNVISVNASAVKYAVDTYIVVQNVCGNITRDTMLLRTVGLGLSPALSNREGVRVSPNPSTGNFTITQLPSYGGVWGGIKIYDLLGRVVHHEPLNFTNKEATLKLNIPTGSYILELKDEAGNVQRERLVIQ